MFRSVIAGAIGLNVTDAECIDFLLEAGGATAGQLADLTGLTTGAITTVIRRLETAGYVLTARDPRDRRRVIITPRPQNMATAGRHYASYGEQVSQLLDSYTDEQLRFLTSHYQRLSATQKAEIDRIGIERSNSACPTTAETGEPHHRNTTR
jgi:DNA-binding MarR family transcriptional regulator